MKQKPIPPEARALSRAHARRRPFVLAGLVLAFILFWMWIPRGSRFELLRTMLAQRGVVAGLLIFLLLALSFLWARGQELDTRIFLFVNVRGKRPQWLDVLMWLTTQIGNGLIAGIIAVQNIRFGDRGFGVGLILGTVSLGFVAESLKEITNRARPFLVHAKARTVGWIERGRSFPSGHTAQAFFLMTTVANFFHPSLLVVIGLYAIATLVGITRVYLGMHYPRDVIGGAVLGTFWGVLASIVGAHSPFQI